MARGLIARAWLGGTEVERRLGRFTLRDAQRQSVERILAAFREFGGALVVDPPGSGKTIVALAVARVFRDPLVVIPATLRAQWQRSADRAGVPIRLVTTEALSRGRAPDPPDLLIVDEAHHARTPGTARHRALTRLAVSARVLLLTATPVVNRRTDRDALLALFLGARASRLDAGDLEGCVLQHGREAPRMPRVRRLAAIPAGVGLPDVGESLRALPPPFPLVEGAEATALIRMSLALAWSSSLAALDRALARRLQRGDAIRDLLDVGRAPTHEALRHWLVTDEGTQLALAELLAPAVELSPDADPRAESQRRREALAALDLHLRAVRTLRSRITPHVAEDADRRARAIRALAASHPDRRIVVFARHTETIEALHRALRTVPGVVMITGTGVRAAAGRWTRDEVLAAVGPRAGPLDPRHPRAIHLVLATDLIAEGVELSGIGIVVHADLPWTPARLTQRRGRIARPGGVAPEVLETRFTAPREARMLVRLGARLRRKRHAAAGATREAAARAAVGAVLRRWAMLSPGAPVAAVESGFEGFVAAVRSDAEVVLVGGRRDGARGRWRLTTAMRVIGELCASAVGEECAAEARAVEDATRRVTHFLERQRARALLGGTALRPGDASARAARRLELVLTRATPRERPAIAAILRRALDRATGTGGHAFGVRAESLAHATADDREFVARIGSLLDEDPSTGARAEPGRAHLVGLLLLTPAVPRAAAAPPPAGPPSASPGTAAPR